MCGYDLTGIQSGDRCPECGKPSYDKQEVLDPRAMADRRAAAWAGIGVIAVAVFLAMLLVWFAGILSRT
jgi:hypothetical protein